MNAILNSLVESVVAEQGTVTATEVTQAEAGTLPSQQVAAAHAETEKKFAARELVYVNNPKYQHLDFIPGSFAQDTTRQGHEKFANKIRMKIRCGCQLDGESEPCQEIVERATSDFHTFMGCADHTKIVKKLRKAEKDLAALRK